MTEPSPNYLYVKDGRATMPIHLPRRAANLARKALQIEEQCNGRGRVVLEIVMIDGEWLLLNLQPGDIERLGDG